MATRRYYAGAPGCAARKITTACSLCCGPGPTWEGNRQAWRIQRLGDGTIKLFEDFFSNGDRVLRTASEVCSLPLIPLGANITESGPPYSNLTSFWNDHRMTSDTLRETPYKLL